MEHPISSSHAKKYFVVDEKFQEVITQLSDRNWCEKRFVHNDACIEDDPIDTTMESLIWTNLKNIKFDQPFINEMWVNHFKGAQHLSNKAFLAYHLANAQCQSLLPETWSPAYQTVPELVEMLMNVTIDSYASRWSQFSVDSHQRHCKVQQLQTVLNRLRSSSLDKQRVFMYQQRIDQLDKAHTSQSSSTSSTSFGGRANHTNIWIVKPVGLSCGEKIEVCRGLEETLSTAKGFNYKCIVQKYIENPLLVRDRRKFDIRQWVLVTSLKPLVIFGFSECYLRVSSTPYSLNDEDLQNKFVHLCNHAIQKLHSSQDRDVLEEHQYACETMMSQQEFDFFLSSNSNVLQQEATNISFEHTILPQIKDISIKAVSAVRDKLQATKKSFEWLGLDLMVTENLEVKLIEVNVSPDISHSTIITTPLVKSSVADLLAMILDEYCHDESFHYSRVVHAPAHMPRWDCWFAEGQMNRENLAIRKGKEGNPPFRADCIPLFASIGDMILSALQATSKTDVTTSLHSKTNILDDDDEI